MATTCPLPRRLEGVWIRAVLEHVLEPAQVVAEVHRVLAAGDIVYAETPFMQQVHEKAYDFTRFSRTGHRWLFRHFEKIAAGEIGGPGQSLVWSLRYFFRGADPLRPHRDGRRPAVLLAALFRSLNRIASRRRCHPRRVFSWSAC
jgi:hypothetical protein